MNSILENFVLTKFERALVESEATQLCLNIFCSVDWLPKHLKEVEWNRNRISKEFSILATQGLIAKAGFNGYNELFWNERIDQFLNGRIILDEEFRRRLA